MALLVFTVAVNTETKECSFIANFSDRNIAPTLLYRTLVSMEMQESAKSPKAETDPPQK